MNSNTLSKFNLFFLFVSIVWEPIQKFYLHVDGAGRVLLLLTILAILSNFVRRHDRHVFRSGAFVCWTFLVLYTFVNSMAKGWSGEYGLFTYIRANFLAPYVFLWIALIELNRNKERCLKVVLWALILYALLGFLNMSLMQNERFSAEGLSNSLPLTCVSMVFVASVLYADNCLKGRFKTLAVIVLFALIITVLTATRKALGAIIIILIGVLLSQFRKSNAKSVLGVVVAIVIMFFGVQWLMDNTLIGSRIAGSADKFNYPLSSNPVVNKFLMTLLGDRSFQYYVGAEVFHDHPITGIGLYNFITYTHLRGRLHTEYMVQLVENGVVGFSLLMLFYILLLSGLYKLRKRGENIWLYLFGLGAVLFINLTAWTYDRLYIMLIYAIIITRIYSRQRL